MNRISAGLACLGLIIILLDPAAGKNSGQSVPQPKTSFVRIGAVAYAPSVVTVFNNLKQYLDHHEFPSDYVLYSNYDALVAALERHEVDIAWNTPLAHARYHVRNGGSSQTLVMRDVDCNVRSVLVARADSGITSLKDLIGKKLVLGSLDAAEATVLPIHYLERNKLDFDQIKILSLDKQVDFKGNPCSSPSHVLYAVCEGRGDAGIITESLWRQVEADPAKNATLVKVWTSPPFSHCVFTASSDFDQVLAKRFTELMTDMEPSDSACADIMRLEGDEKVAAREAPKDFAIWSKQFEMAVNPKR